jgi:pilus assembly protein Flp/PilA
MLGIAKRILANRSGATAIEYALIASLIAVVIAAAVGALGTQLSTTFTNVTAQFPG